MDKIWQECSSSKYGEHRQIVGYFDATQMLYGDVTEGAALQTSMPFSELLLDYFSYLSSTFCYWGRSACSRVNVLFACSIFLCTLCTMASWSEVTTVDLRPSCRPTRQ